MEIRTSYKEIIKKIKDRSPVSLQECPLTNDSSTVLDNDVNFIKRYSRVFFCQADRHYKLLSSQSFFKWLLTLDDKTIIDDELCNKLLKEYVRDGNDNKALRFSLRDINYVPEILNRRLQKLKGNMLDADYSLVFPVLQFLEGIYYAATIVEDVNNKMKAIAPAIEKALRVSPVDIVNNEKAQEKLTKVPIVFLLPNKEFTYYTTVDEKPLFASFNTVLKKLLLKNCNYSEVSILFQPFAFGTDIYDAPYKSNSKSLEKNNLLHYLDQLLERREDER